MGRYLVTGGAGFIGSNLVQEILERGDHVRVLDDFSTGKRENLSEVERWAGSPGRFDLLEGDVRDPADCRRALHDVDFVLHHAAIPSVQRSVSDPYGTHTVNIDGTVQLLLAAREAGVRRFVFASSSSLYGESETLPKVESMVAAPISPYGLQKFAAESYCALFNRLYGVPTVALRYFNVFGPRQDPASEYAAVIPRFIRAIRDGRSPVVYGDGEQTRDFTYVANVVRANLNACVAGPAALGKAFNVACGRRLSLNALIAGIARIAGRHVVAEHEPARPGDIKHSLAAIGEAERVLGYRPEVDFDEGLRRTWDALR